MQTDISDYVHILATEEALDRLIGKCGSTYIRITQCQGEPSLCYTILRAFPGLDEKNHEFRLAWTDSMDFYVVVKKCTFPITTFLRAIGLLRDKDEATGWQILCAEETYFTLGLRASWSKLGVVKWDQLPEQFPDVIACYPSQRLWSQQRTVREDPTDIRFQLTYDLSHALAHSDTLDYPSVNSVTLMYSRWLPGEVCAQR